MSGVDVSFCDELSSSSVSIMNVLLANCGSNGFSDTVSCVCGKKISSSTFILTGSSGSVVAVFNTGVSIMFGVFSTGCLGESGVSFGWGKPGVVLFCSGCMVDGGGIPGIVLFGWGRLSEVVACGVVFGFGSTGGVTVFGASGMFLFGWGRFDAEGLGGADVGGFVGGCEGFPVSGSAGFLGGTLPLFGGNGGGLGMLVFI